MDCIRRLLLVKKHIINLSSSEEYCFASISLQVRLVFHFASSMGTKSVFISNPDVPEPAVKLLTDRYNVIINEDVTKSGILSNVVGVDAIFWSAKLKLDKDILDAAGPQLKIVSSMSAGLDKYDIDDFKRRGLKLTNTPNVLNSSVAELAVLLLLAAARRFHEGRLKIQNNNWPSVNTSQWMLGLDVEGSTVGIVGFGNIGQAILKRLKSFNVHRFIYSGHKEKPEGKKLGAEFVTLDKLLKESDFVIVCVPLTQETKGMFNDTCFTKMKKTAVFVNISRGQVVNQNDLIKALKSDTIFAAGLDVMTPEPLPADHELLTLHNCVIAPHIGSATIKTRTAMANLAANNIINCLEGKDLITPVY